MGLIETTIISVAILLIAIFILKRWKKQNTKTGTKIKTLCVFVPYVLFVFLFGRYFLGDLERPSTVDISPVAQLENIDFSDIDKVFEKIKNSQERIGGEGFKKTNLQAATRSCRYSMHDWSIPATVDVSVEFYDNEELAKAQFNYYRSERSGNKYKYIEISQDIEAVLANSRVNRSSDIFYSIINRSVGTRIRVQNIVFSFGEGSYDKAIGQASSAAIEKLFNVLSELKYMQEDNYIIQFDKNNSIGIEIPENWDSTILPGTFVPGLAQTYNVRITPPSGEKALLTITVGKSETGEPFTREQFDELVDWRVSSNIDDAVEKTPTYYEISKTNGYGKYCILTDALFVGKEVPSDEYRCVAIIYFNYINDCIVYATALTDDPESIRFQQMLDIVASIEPSLEEAAGI